MADEFRCAEIGIFWNTVDFPISDDVDRDEIFGIITSSLSIKGYFGDLSIWAYAEENTPNCNGAGIIFGKVEISALTNRMIMDILFWAMNTREPSNLVVIAKDILEESELISVLAFLKSKYFNVVLVTQPDEVDPDELHAATEGDRPKIEELLRAGADCSVKDGDGRTALVGASSKEICDLILGYTAQKA